MANYQPPTSGKFEIIHNLTIPIPKCDPFVPKAMDTPTMRVSLLSNLSSPTFKFPATSIPILPTNSINQKKHQLMMMSNSQKNNNVFDEATFEENRLARDAKARESMEQALVKEIQEDYPKSWKWKIRKMVWDFMEANNIAQFPRPVHHRIPNFVGAPLASNKVIIYL